jgi:hypothetical protein
LVRRQKAILVDLEKELILTTENFFTYSIMMIFPDNDFSSPTARLSLAKMASFSMSPSATSSEQVRNIFKQFRIKVLKQTYMS